MHDDTVLCHNTSYITGNIQVLFMVFSELTDFTSTQWRRSIDPLMLTDLPLQMPLESCEGFSLSPRPHS